MAILVLATIETTILTSKGGQMAAEGRNGICMYSWNALQGGR